MTYRITSNGNIVESENEYIGLSLCEVQGLMVFSECINDKIHRESSHDMYRLLYNKLLIYITLKSKK